MIIKLKLLIIQMMDLKLKKELDIMIINQQLKNN